MIHRNPDTPGKVETAGNLVEIPRPEKVEIGKVETGKVEMGKVEVGKVEIRRVEIPGEVENDYDMQHIEHI